jgi:hypothetical protein
VAGAGRSSTPVTWQPRPVRFGVQDARGGDGRGNSPGMCATGAYRVGQRSGVGAVGLGGLPGLSLRGSSSASAFRTPHPFDPSRHGHSVAFWGAVARRRRQWAGVGIPDVVVGVSGARRRR